MHVQDPSPERLHHARRDEAQVAGQEAEVDLSLPERPEGLLPDVLHGAVLDGDDGNGNPPSARSVERWCIGAITH